MKSFPVHFVDYISEYVLVQEDSKDYIMKYSIFEKEYDAFSVRYFIWINEKQYKNYCQEELTIVTIRKKLYSIFFQIIM